MAVIPLAAGNRRGFALPVLDDWFESLEWLMGVNEDRCRAANDLLTTLLGRFDATPAQAQALGERLSTLCVDEARWPEDPCCIAVESFADDPANEAAGADHRLVRASNGEDWAMLLPNGAVGPIEARRLLAVVLLFALNDCELRVGRYAKLVELVPPVTFQSTILEQARELR